MAGDGPVPAIGATVAFRAGPRVVSCGSGVFSRPVPPCCDDDEQLRGCAREARLGEERHLAAATSSFLSRPMSPSSSSCGSVSWGPAAASAASSLVVLLSFLCSSLFSLIVRRSKSNRPIRWSSLRFVNVDAVAPTRGAASARTHMRQASAATQVRPVVPGVALRRGRRILRDPGIICRLGFAGGCPHGGSAVDA